MVAAVQLHDVGVRYGRTQVLSGVSTPPLAPGEITAVIGPNAAGKSSLFRRLAGLAEGPGAVSMPPGTRVCYMPQDTSVNTVLTVYESILLARKQGGPARVSPADLAAVDAVIASVSIGPIAFRSLAELSGGQRQLVSLAQTLVREPQVLLLDEPTSALDLNRQIEVMDLVRDIARSRGICAILAMHDLNQVLRIADRVMVIAGGRLVAFGAASQVITAELLFETYRVVGRVEHCSRGCPHVIVDRPVPPSGGASAQPEDVSANEPALTAL